MSARPDPSEAARIDHAAADWVVRRDRGLSAREQDEFLQWLAADPRHGERLAAHQATWGDFNLLAEWRPAHSAEPNPDLLAKRRPRRWPLWVPFAAAAALACGALWWSGRPGPAAPPAVAAAAPSYERRVLEDGSIVELNRGAQVEVSFTPAERRVALLAGEASFTVAKNKARPFIVRAAGVDVRAVGTVFNVRLDRAQVEVLVSEGKVHITPPAAPERPELPLLVAGQRAVVSLRPGAPPPEVTEVSAEEMALTLAWQPRLLDFAARPLEEVVAEFNRHNRVQLAVADPAIARLPIVASFRSDNIDGFTRLLELTADIRADRRADGTIELRRR